MDCLFCKIVNGEIPASVVYENEHVLVIKDINPVAPVHVLIIPKKHYKNILEAVEADESVVIEIHRAVKEAAELTGIAEDGFRLVNNCGKNAGQSVEHLHYHLIGGVQMGERLL